MKTTRIQYAVVCIILCLAAVGVQAQFNVLDWWLIASSSARAGEAAFTVPVSVNGNTVALDASLTAAIGQIPANASFSFDLLSDSPSYVGNGGKVLALNAGGDALEWVAVAGVGSMSHATLSDLDYAGSGHTGFAASTDLDAYQPIASMSDYALASSLGDYQPVASMAEYALDTDIPGNASFTLAGLSEKSYSSLTDLPTFGTMASETATDYLKVADVKDFVALASEATGNATFSYTFDVATLTVGGVDVLGDVHSALAEILGEW